MNMWLCCRTCCVCADEGHGFARPPNRLDFCSRVDQFLAKHLGGRTEPPLQMQVGLWGAVLYVGMDLQFVAYADVRALQAHA